MILLSSSSFELFCGYIPTFCATLLGVVAMVLGYNHDLGWLIIVGVLGLDTLEFARKKKVAG